MSTLDAELPLGATDKGRCDESSAELTSPALSSPDENPEQRAQSAEADTTPCANCGTDLLGPHCYQCGQPVKGLVRPFSNIVGDFFDTLLALDSRIWRTLWPLLVKPGFLTREYFAGRRMRYVSPVRLFIFLCLTTFFVLRLSTDWGQSILDDGPLIEEFANAETVEEVERIRDEMIAELDREIDAAQGGVVEPSLRVAQGQIRGQAGRRIGELRINSEGLSLPGQDGETKPGEQTTGAADFKDWTITEPQECTGDACEQSGQNALNISGFDFAPGLNAWLSGMTEQAERNFKLVQEDPNLFKEAFFRGIPSTLLVLLPLFSLLLWCLYLLKRRIYMEHLIVALHSHAFLCFALLLFVGQGELADWLGEGWPRLQQLLSFTGILLLLWMPVYLLLMQKRVYDQGWPLTLVKFWSLGIVYSVLVVFATSLTALTALATL